MITSVADRETERLSQRHPVRRFPAELYRVMLRTLVQLDAVIALDELRVPPVSRLEKLKGDRAGQYSIRVNDEWRVCFRWNDGAPQDVAIVDYHDEGGDHGHETDTDSPRRSPHGGLPGALRAFGVSVGARCDRRSVSRSDFDVVALQQNPVSLS